VKSRFVISTIMTITFVVGGAWLVANHQQVIDWWRLASYTPSVEIKQLADNDAMSGRGRDLFYASDPHVEAGADFNNACTSQNEKTIVLGCYKAQRIFLYNVTDTRLDGVKEVTAAHEMLHAAYERLSNADKQHVNALLKPIIEDMKDQRILDLITLYNQQEPGELYNEMHSILGTEHIDLSPELEEYYKQYFTGRRKIVDYSEQYQAVFVQSQNKLDEYDKQLDSLKSNIDESNNALRDRQAQLEAESNQLNQLQAKGQVQAYNQAIPNYNAKVREFNALVEQTRQLVQQYNAIVVERNNQAAAQNNLYQSLDSRYQTVPQN
jgi:uncharacterized coiled-coil DUF342 family protein